MMAATHSLFVMITALAGQALGSGLSLGGGFASQCAITGASLINGRVLGLHCLNNDVAVFGYNYTWIDLNLCLGNNLGQLVAFDHGNFSDTCTDCFTVTDTQTLSLTCSCWDQSDHHLPTTVDLNTTIYNDDGCMGCFGHQANCSMDRPFL